MRKLPLLLVSALALALGVAGIAQAVDSEQKMNVKVQKNKAGTKKKPKSVGKLTVDLSVTADPSNPGETGSFATQRTVIFFDKNLVFNGAKFPSCTAVQAYNNKGLPQAACKKAKVGGGQAQGVALGQIQNLTVTGWNGPKGKSLLLRVQGDTPLAIDSLLVGKLSKASGKFGTKLTVDIPSDLQKPLGPETAVFATLTRFLTTVGGTTKKKLPYVGLAGCPKNKQLQFKGDFTFTDGSTQSPTDTVACRK